jgi:hypothetical protein
VSGAANVIRVVNKTYDVSSPKTLTLDADLDVGDINFYTYIKNGGKVLLTLVPAYGLDGQFFTMDVTTLLKEI